MTKVRPIQMPFVYLSWEWYTAVVTFYPMFAPSIYEDIVRGHPKNKIESIVSMQDLKLSIIQSDLAWEDPAANLHRFEKVIGTPPLGSDLIVLPEMFSTGFSMNAKSLAQKMTGPAVCWMQQMAIDLKRHIAGSMIISENNHYYNRLVWAAPDQSLLTYDKKHLFRYAGENRVFTPGKHHLTVTLKQWRVRPFICYDLRFPIWTRNLNNSYDVAVFVANWPAKRSTHWRSLLVARAIENQCYVIGVNRVGQDGNQLTYSGDSMVIGPEGEVMADAENKPALINVTLSAESLAAYRSDFPAWRDADGDMVQAGPEIDDVLK